jgi:hypothetical protein
MMNLENEIAAAPISEAATAAELGSLVARAEKDIVSADAEAKKQEAAMFDPAIGPDPRIARDAHEDALVKAGRLRTMLARLNRRRSAVEAEERLAAWRKEAASLGEERDALALEFDTDYQAAVTKLADLFARMTALDGKLTKLYLDRPSGVTLTLTNPELMARGLSQFSRAHPSLLKQVQLFDKNGTQVWPPPQNRSFSIPVIDEPGRNADWWRPELKEAREAEAAREQKRLADYYESKEKERAQREERERVAAK